MRLLFGHDQAVWQWVETKWGTVGRAPDAAFGIIDGDGVLRGALMLHAENAWTAELAVYSESAITPKIARSFFKVAFGDLGLWRLQIRTQRDNKAIKKAAPKMGWKFEGVARGFYGPHGDALLFYMTPELCRWIKHENAQSAQAA